MMSTPESRSTEAEPTTGALTVLRDMLTWELAPPRWERLAELLDLAAAARESGDLDALRQVVADLELAGPVRITRLGATPAVPAPRPVRERINVLIHELGGPPREADEEDES